VKTNPSLKSKKAHKILWFFGNFDPLEWWGRKGARKYPRVSRISPRRLTKQSHNGQQERSFSANTVIDSPLRRKLSEETFEANRDLLRKFFIDQASESDEFNDAKIKGLGFDVYMSAGDDKEE
jgi:hypothetical protein